MRCLRCKGNLDNKYQTCSKCLWAAREYKRLNKDRIKAINRAWKQKHWARCMVCHSRDSDRKYGRLPTDMTDYIAPGFLQELRTAQQNRCFFCTIDMQHHFRKLHDGISIQRLVNSRPHNRENCVLSCFRCNCKRCETGIQKTYLELKRAQLYFDRLIRGGYQNLDDKIRVPQIF